ncbi:MAG: hypothetical protein K0R93_3349 [Anaerosolibacter sp.]|jgi:hypothetical protein|nr:hypothetical protein [Anaerosolibacter sp.]
MLPVNINTLQNHSFVANIIADTPFHWLIYIHYSTGKKGLQELYSE